MAFELYLPLQCSVLHALWGLCKIGTWLIGRRKEEKWFKAVLVDTNGSWDWTLLVLNPTQMLARDTLKPIRPSGKNSPSPMAKMVNTKHSVFREALFF